MSAEDMLRIATRLWGPPNRKLSHGNDIRFGSRGSKSIALDTREWFDHEAGRGGGECELWKMAGESSGSGDVVATYDYRDKAGKLLFQVVRKQGHKFVQRRPDPSAPDGWRWSLKGVQRVLYRLPELLAADGSQLVFVVEGEKDADNLRLAGLVATTNPGGAGKWLQEFNEYLRGRDVLILPDNDEPGREHAGKVARMLNDVARSVRIVTLPDLPEKGDVSDWLAAGGTVAELRALAIAAAPASADNGKAEAADKPDVGADGVQAEISRLGRLPLLKFAQQRAAAAKLLRIPLAMLDKLVALERGDVADAKGQGKPLDLPAPDPWPMPVTGAALLSSLKNYFARHLVLPKGAAVVMALWTVHCHCFEVFHFTPRLQFKSVTKGSGKSTAIQLLGYIVPRPLETETITQAFLYRAIEMARPTVLMDEADTYLRDDEDLRGMVNAGVKPGATAGRCVGDNQEPRVFSCHAPIALAGIGSLPGTIEDRSIKIMMKRRLRGERIRPIEDITRRLGERLRRKAARWTQDHVTKLRAKRPDMKPLFNRAADRWRALYAIAEIAGDDWPKLTQDAMQAIADADDDDADSLNERLLADVRNVFDAWFAEQVEAEVIEPKHDLLPAVLVERLLAMEDRPWPEMGRSRRPLTTTMFARMVGKFGVRRRRLWDADAGKAGPWVYLRTDFDEAFGRYLDA